MNIKIYHQNFFFEIFLVVSIFIYYYVDNEFTHVGQYLIYADLIVWFAIKCFKYTLNNNLYIAILIASLVLSDNLVAVIGILTASLYFMLNVKQRKQLIPDISTIMFMGVVFVGAIATKINAIDKDSGMHDMLLYFMLAILVYVFDITSSLMVESEHESVRLYSELSLILGLVFFVKNSIFNVWTYSHSSTFYNGKNGVGSNTLAGILAPFVVANILIFFLSKDNLTKLLSSLASIVIMIIVFSLQSRGAYLGIAISLLWLFLRGNSKRIKVKIMIGLMGGVLFLYFNKNVFLRMFGRFFTVVKRTGNQLNGRELLYKKAEMMFKSHKILGCGFGQFFHYAKAYDPHNVILAYLAYTGIIGCLFFIMFIVFKYFKLKNYISNSINIKAMICVITLIVYLTHAMVEPVLTTQFPLTLFIVFTTYFDNWPASLDDCSRRQN